MSKLGSIFSLPVVSELVSLAVPEVFAVANTLIASHPKLAPFAAEFAALEAEVLALVKQPTAAATPVAPVA